ncbi:EMB2654 [Symbiodinium sp. CCMP2592]|nr:EMB2654 [Symbiodinium sp. CCMP2592]
MLKTMKTNLIAALAEDGLPDNSTALIRNLVSGKAGPLTLPDFQRLLIASRGRWSEAVMLLQELRRRDLQPSVFQWQRDFGWVTTALEASGMWQKALELLRWMALSDLEVNHVAETASGWRLRDGAGENARKEATKALLNPRLRKMLMLRLYTAKARKDAADVEVVATALRSYGAPKPRDYVVLLSAYGAVHLWQSALGVLKEMQTLQFAPDIVSYNAALKACERGCQWSAALALFYDMPSVMLNPDQISYTALIESLGQQKFWEQALQLLASMDTEGTAPDVVAYSAAMAACAKAQKWWLSLGLLAELEARNLLPDQVCMGIALNACEFSRKWRHAVALLRRVTGSRKEGPDLPGEVDFLGLTAAEWRPLEKALGIIEEIDWLPEDPNEDPELEKKWQEFRRRHQVSDWDARGLEDWHAAVAAEQVLHTLGQSEIPINTYIYRAAIGACSRCKKVEMACTILDEMSCRFPLTAMLVTDVVSGLADVSDWCRAIHLLALPDHPDTVLYNAVMEACGRASQWERATHILQQLTVEQLSPSVVTFNTLLSCYVQCKKTGKVEKLLRSMQDFRVAPDGVTESFLEDETLLRSARIQALRRGTIIPLEKNFSLHEV